MRERADGIDLEKLVGRLGRVGTGRAVRDSAWRNALAVRTVRRATRLAEAIDRAGALYVPGRLHRVRIAAKKLRYVLEVAEEVGITGVGELVRSLQGVQGTLGRWHDLQSLVDCSRDVQASSGSKPENAELDGFIQVLERECRRLHAEFVVGREDLLRICTRARREIAREITVGRPAAARATVARKAQAETRSARGPAGADVRPAAERGERHG
jgi:hypothetical protein